MSSAQVDADTDRPDGSEPKATPAEPDAPRTGAPSWYDVLEVEEVATHAEVQRAYDRALALVDGRSIGGYLMLDPIAAESARADVETAHAVLSSPDRRAAYDLRLSTRRGGSARERSPDARALQVTADASLASAVAPAAANSVDLSTDAPTVRESARGAPVEGRSHSTGAASTSDAPVRFEPPKTWPGQAPEAGERAPVAATATALHATASNRVS